MGWAGWLLLAFGAALLIAWSLCRAAAYADRTIDETFGGSRETDAP